MVDYREAMAARFGISALHTAPRWLDLDPVERQRLWRRASRKAKVANTSKTPKPALIYPALYK